MARNSTGLCSLGNETRFGGWPDMTTTRMSPCVLDNVLASSIPVIPGMATSVSRTSIRPACTAASIAAAHLAFIGVAHAGAPKSVSPIKPGSNTSFATLKQVAAGDLSVGYAETGPANGAAVTTAAAEWTW